MKCVALVLCGILIGVGTGRMLAPHAVIILRPKTCPQTVYNDGPNYEYRVMRYRWRHV